MNVFKEQYWRERGENSSFCCFKYLFQTKNCQFSLLKLKFDSLYIRRNRVREKQREAERRRRDA